MIWSVSTLLRRSGIPVPVCWVKASMVVVLSGGRAGQTGAGRSEGLARWPATAVAAATGTDTRWVRPPLP